MVLATAPVAAASLPGYYVQGGTIYGPDAEAIQIRGINHFGFSSRILQPQFLWEMGWKAQLEQIRALGFNAVRVPFAPAALHSRSTVDRLNYIDPDKNAELLGKTPLEVLDLWMAEAGRQSLYVVLDFHSVAAGHLYPQWFIEDPEDFALSHDGAEYTEDDWIADLRFVAERYADMPHFMGIDLYNEPRGRVRWSAGDPSVSEPRYFWKRAAERAAAAVLQANPRLLIFVQGVHSNPDGIEDASIPKNWGENLQAHAYAPLQIPYDKLVLSPHTYGPDVFAKSTFDAPDFPDNLAADWERLFGQHYPAHPVVIGEWGGRYGEGGTGAADVAWQDALVDYLGSKGIHSSFYWSYTPNSTDTGGILDDDLQVREDKMALLRRHWNPSAAPSEPEDKPLVVDFTPSKNINEWWVEVWTQASEPLASVAVQVEEGEWRTLPATSWGSWARSFHLPRGTTVRLRATTGSDTMATSSPFLWMESGPAEASSSGDPEAPAPEVAFEVSGGVNEWWVEVWVEASLPLSQVDVQVDGGDWISLPATSWGSWARSFFVAAGTAVRFRAVTESGEAILSDTRAWLGSGDSG